MKNTSVKNLEKDKLEKLLLIQKWYENDLNLRYLDAIPKLCYFEGEKKAIVMAIFFTNFMKKNAAVNVWKVEV